MEFSSDPHSPEQGSVYNIARLIQKSPTMNTKVKSLAVLLFLASMGACPALSQEPNPAGMDLDDINRDYDMSTDAFGQPDSIQQFFDGVDSRDITIVKKLLSNGVDVNAVNETGQTALHVTQNIDITRLLLEHGGNVHAIDDAGMTPLFNKETDVAAVLLDAGADINARSAKGNTPFTWHAYSGYLDGLRFLASRGADVNTCNTDNQSPLDIATRFHPNTEVLKYMQTLDIQSCDR